MDNVDRDTMLMMIGFISIFIIMFMFSAISDTKRHNNFKHLCEQSCINYNGYKTEKPYRGKRKCFCVNGKTELVRKLIER